MARRQRRWGGLRRIVGWTVIAAAFAGALVAFVLYREITASLPPVEHILGYQPPVATRVYADDGTLIGELYTERRYLVPLARIPQHVRLAFLAAEDADFYRHRGVDPESIARALLANLASGEVVQGGSTITQQVVKQLLLSPERSLERKVKEALLALRLETRLSKEDILYLYLNQIYFGAGAYGVASAAREFFDVEVEDLTVAQAALLAGLPQRPSAYDPQRHPTQARARQRHVLDRMRAEGFITEAQHQQALGEELVFARRRPTSYLAAPWYVEHVRRLLEDRYGGTAPYQLGLQVHTACNLTMERFAEDALREGVRQVDRRQGFRGPIRHLDAKKIEAFLEREAAVRPLDAGRARGVVMDVHPQGLVVRTAWEQGLLPSSALALGTRRLAPSTFRPGDVIAVTVTGETPRGGAAFALDQEPQIEGALVAIDLYTGQVKAMAGGYDFRRSQFNRVVQARRQAGSAFKPLVYATAIEHGYSPASIVLDAPITLSNGALPPWSPRNYKDRYYGPTPLRMALARSLNTVTVRLVDSIGIGELLGSLPRFGFSRRFRRDLSLALGTAEVTPLELTRAYGVFATGGKRFEPIFITRVTDLHGNPLEFGSTRPRFARVMSSATAYIVTSMLQSVVQHGTGRSALALGRPAAGKTGTTNDTVDAWFVGYTPDLIAGVWVGFDSERSLGGEETGGRAAAPIWTAFMTKAVAGQPAIDFPVPDDVSFVQIDRATGLRAVPDQPSELEIFVKGSEPTAYAPLPDEFDFGEELPPPGGADADPLADGF